MSTMENKLHDTSDTIKTFTLKSLQDITNNFSEEHIIGRGGYGIVYKGVLDNGEEVALKKLHCIPGIDDRVFKNEFSNLMKARHKNITRLVGYCYHKGHEIVEMGGVKFLVDVEERVLCIEYLQSGGLEKYLSDESHNHDWLTRYKIIKGVCEGLDYLHNGHKDPIYHMDLKPENILLDKDMTPKIGDFGLSRLFPPKHTYVTTKMIGTFGYMPPEYIEKGEITSKFDVFSLGVIIIKIIAGNEGYAKFPDFSSQEFVEHVHENWRKRLGKIMSSHTSEEVTTCLRIALECVKVDRVSRPAIRDIVSQLNKIDIVKSSPISEIANLRCQQTTKQYSVSGYVVTNESDENSCPPCGGKHETIDSTSGGQGTHHSDANELLTENVPVAKEESNCHGGSLLIGQLVNKIVAEVPATNAQSDASFVDHDVVGNLNHTDETSSSVALGNLGFMDSDDQYISSSSSKILLPRAILEKEKPPVVLPMEETRVKQMGENTCTEATTSVRNLVYSVRAYDFVFKLILVGDSGVGKTNLCLRFSNGSFTTSFVTTISVDLKLRTVELDGKWIKLQIWDKGRQERFQSITSAYCRGAMGILLVYDVTDESSFNDIRYFKQRVTLDAAPDVRLILVGNKADMHESKRAVTTSRGQALADEYGIKFFETSAKTKWNVDEVFFSLTREIIQSLATKTSEDRAPNITQRHKGPLAFARELFSKKKAG